MEVISSQAQQFKQEVEEKKASEQIVEPSIPIAKEFSEPHALGCIAAALIGDSCGSFYQFAENELSEVEMDFCMTFPGGGPHQLNSGQVTDGGELALVLMHAFSEFENNADKFDIELILKWYKLWALANPFDLEDNINCTIMKLQEDDTTSEMVKKAAHDELYSSCTNSSIMHIAPVAVWATEIDNPNVHRAIMVAFTELTHANPLIHDAAFIYSQAIGFLINNAKDPAKIKKAFEHAVDLSKSHTKS